MLAGRFASQTYDDPLSPEALLEMQTINAAAAAGMSTELGSLESGKRADVVVRSARAAEAYPANNPLHLLTLTMGAGRQWIRSSLTVKSYSVGATQHE